MDALRNFTVILFLLVFAGSDAALADNFCSGEHGSGGGGLIENAEGKMVLPDHMRAYFKSPAAPTVKRVGSSPKEGSLTISTLDRASLAFSAQEHLAGRASVAVTKP